MVNGAVGARRLKVRTAGRLLRQPRAAAIPVPTAPDNTRITDEPEGVASHDAAGSNVTVKPRRNPHRGQTAGIVLGALSLILLLSGCGATVPADPEGTLERASGGGLRVGVTDNGRWVDVREGGDPTGTEPTLIASFASSLDAEVTWIPGSEQELVKDLEHGELDVMIGGLTDDTPWSKQAGMTRPYIETTDERDDPEKHVMLVRRGENALLLELDTFLLSADVGP